MVEKGKPPFDDNGHGTHTASTAAGNFVEHANISGSAAGTAVGMAPRAHLAIYKVCGLESCSGPDILWGMEEAIKDGVDVLSLSLGGPPLPFYNDSLAIGGFTAAQRGILVSASGGNSGPGISSISNEAPWLLTVAASTMDRSLKGAVKLGNGEEFDGESIIQPRDFHPNQLPLIYFGNCGQNLTEGLDVEGKIIVCESEWTRVEDEAKLKIAGVAAMIITNPSYMGFSMADEGHSLPAARVSFQVGESIKAYLNSSTQPTATILFKGTVIGNSSAPEIAYFSSRGPSVTTPGILKPDITGPGVNVLAAWPEPKDATTLDLDRRFSIISGTSMSCPHISGVAALLKSSHPEWSPAAIKSAMMTTADALNRDGHPILDERLKPADFFAMGAGHINPARANDPGLVYDIQPVDYMHYLCGLGYEDNLVKAVVTYDFHCTKEVSLPEAQLNYPSFSVALGPSASMILKRTVTNVGEAKSSYTVKISVPHGVDVSVKPSHLHFNLTEPKLTYTVTFKRKTGVFEDVISKPYAQGFLEWVSHKHTVRNLIAVKFI